MMRNRIEKHIAIGSAVVLLLLVGALAPPASAQSGGDYDLSWSTIDGGGGTSSGGDFPFSGTIGQPDAGEMIGGDYVLTGSFWYGPGCIVDLNDLALFCSQWLQSGDIESNFDWSDNPQPENLVDLHDFGTLASYWLEWCPEDWPWTDTGRVYYCNFADPNAGHSGTHGDPWNIEDLNAASFSGGDIVECWGTGHTPIILSDGGDYPNSRVTIRQRQGYPPAVLDFQSVEFEADASGIDTNKQSYLNIQGISVVNLINPPDKKYEYIGIWVSGEKDNEAEYVTLTNCQVHNVKNINTIPRIKFGKGVLIHNARNITIEGGIYSHASVGVYLNRTEHVLISGATIHDAITEPPPPRDPNDPYGHAIKASWYYLDWDGTGSSYLTIKDCEISHTGQSAVYIGRGSKHVYIENNLVHHSGAAGIQIEYKTNDVIVRKNTVHNAGVFYGGECAIWFASNTRGLCENNTVYDNPFGLWISASQNPSSYVIFRNNYAYSNNNDQGQSQGSRQRAGSIVINCVDPNHVDIPSLNWAMVYHNSFYFNGHEEEARAGGVRIQERNWKNNRAHLDHIYVKNNIISEVIGENVMCFINEQPLPTDIAFSHNHYYFDLNDVKQFATWDIYDDPNLIDFSNWKQDHEIDARGGSSVSNDPRFVSPDTGNLRLDFSSPCIDQATYLTTVVSAGSNTIEVKNSKYFMDGYGIPGVDGDIIAIFDSSWQFRGTCQITDVDYENNILTVDLIPAGTVPGDYVIYAQDADGQLRNSSRPDIGAYEYN